MTRRLAAIMFTDIAGYTALSQRDEPAALRLLQDQERLVHGLLEIHRGRLVKSMGDGLLIEFANALDAVEYAVDLQRHIQERNAREPSPELRVRIGIHLGDVEGVGPDILGDAVNIASRIEPLAEPGGVSLSAQIFDQVHNKVPYRLEKLGARALKGIAEPTDVYRAILPWVDGGSSTRGTGLPRLAVLPLANISSDPENEYFADGLTEELITVLSQLHGLRVIARTSVMPYKTSPKPIAQIGTELGVGAILEGSVRRAGDQVRITAQLIDVGSEEHTWAATFDRKLVDVFAIQTEVAKQIADVLKVRIVSTEASRLDAVPTVRPESYLAYLKGRWLLAREFSPGALREALAQFEQAIALDPSSARAHAGAADAIRRLVWWGGYEGPRVTWDSRGRAYAMRAVELEPDLAEGHLSLGQVLWEDRDYKTAEEELQRAISLNPNFSEARAIYANLLMDEARTDEALREIALADELDPQSVATLAWHAWFLYMLRRKEEGRAVIERLGRIAPKSGAYLFALAWDCMEAGDTAGALRHATAASTVVDTESPTTLWPLALGVVGERERALSMLKEAERGAHTVNRTWALAGGYALLGDLDQAFRFLFEGLDDHALSFQVFRNDYRYEPLRRDPRFAQLLKRMNLA